MVKLPKAEDCCQQAKPILHVLVTGRHNEDPGYPGIPYSHSNIGTLQNYGPVNVMCGYKTKGPVGFWICEDCQRRLGLIW